MLSPEAKEVISILCDRPIEQESDLRLDEIYLVCQAYTNHVRDLAINKSN